MAKLDEEEEEGAEDEEEDDLASSPGPDPNFMSQSEPPGSPGRKPDLPGWALGMVNVRGRVPVSKNHFTCVVGIGGACMEAIVDTGGCRSMMDLGTAKAAGLPIKLATPTESYGSFYGAAGEVHEYAGIVEGPVMLKFNKEVSLALPSIKLLKGDQPLVLIGG